MEEIERTRAEEELRNEKLEKGALLVASGRVAYPNKTSRNTTLAQALELFESEELPTESIVVAGRVMAIRGHGALMFLDLFDGTGSLQLYVKADTLDKDAFDTLHDVVDRGDFIEAAGTLLRTKRGEPSLLLNSWKMLTKSIASLPTEHFGIKDEDERYRKRYLDILLNTQLQERIRRRSVFWNSARMFLLERDYIEVETPILETAPGGADARPFVTHHNALDIDIELRISCGELWQKKLLVAGLPKTFEIGRVFRNEGMSHEHLQDYTALEFYEAYSDFEKGKPLVRSLYQYIAEKTYGTLQFTIGEHSIDLGAEWQEYDFSAIMQERFGFDPRDVEEEVAVAALKKHVQVQDTVVNRERAVDTLWKQVRRELAGPGFLVNIPVYLEPLAKRSEIDSRVVERFQIMLAGSEMGKGFSELNDPIDQKARFARQEELRAAGDDEAQNADVEFVEALEYGMPPAFGFGVSERLFAYLENVSAREAQLFPLMRPKT